MKESLKIGLDQIVEIGESLIDTKLVIKSLNREVRGWDWLKKLK